MCDQCIGGRRARGKEQAPRPEDQELARELMRLLGSEKVKECGTHREFVARASQEKA